MEKIIAKELSKSPFKNNDNFDKIFDKIQKIYDDLNKIDIKDRIDELYNKLDELLQKENDPITLRIIGNILEENNCDFAYNFYTKSEDEGYVLENNRYKIELYNNKKIDIYLDTDNYNKIIEKLISLVNEDFNEEDTEANEDGELYSISILDNNNIIADMKITSDIYESLLNEYADNDKYIEVAVTKGDESVFTIYVDYNKYTEINDYIKSQNEIENAQETETFKYDLTITDMKNTDILLFTLLNDEMYNTIYNLAYEHATNELVDCTGCNGCSDCTVTNENANLRSVKVTYENGQVIETSMSAKLSDHEIYNYFKPGKTFNIGSVDDNLQKIKSIKILDKIDWKYFFTLAKDTTGDKLDEFEQLYGYLIEKPHITDALRKSSTYEEFINNIKDFENVNEHIQVMPLAKVFEPNFFDGVKDKSEYNERALRELINRDFFLQFVKSQANKNTEAEDLDTVYKDYIKDNDKYLKQLKTFENMTNHNMSLNTANYVYKDIIEDLLLLFNVNNKEQVLYSVIDYLTNNFDKHKSNYAILTTDIKNDLKQLFTNMSEVDIVEKISNCDIQLDNLNFTEIEKISNCFNISDELALVITQFMQNVYSDYKLRNLTKDDNYAYTICLAIIFKNL